jgi:hypothetical protein
VRSSSAWVRGFAALSTLMIALTFSAPPSDAADASKGAAPKTAEKRSLSAAADAHVAAMAPPPALAQDPGAGATSTSGSFFRSPKGVAAIVLMVAGAGYVAYKIPKDNEKVHSPIR